MKYDIDALCNSLINVSMLSTLDENDIPYKLVKVCNKYGIIGNDIIKFVTEIQLILGGEQIDGIR